MGYGSSVYKSAGDRLAEKRLAAEKRADMRRAEIYSKLPRARELEHQIASCGLEAAKTVLRGGDVVAEMTMLRDKNLALQDELSRLLTENGYDKNSLEPQYSCSKCSDTGYFEQGAITVMCDCMKRELVNCACEELNRTAPLKLSTFESFNIELYSKSTDPETGVVPYTQMEKIYKFCRAYAHSFTPDSGSILMKGATGLGKTHLSLAIARGTATLFKCSPTAICSSSTTWEPNSGRSFPCRRSTISLTPECLRVSRLLSIPISLCRSLKKRIQTALFHVSTATLKSSIFWEAICV